MRAVHGRFTLLSIGAVNVGNQGVRSDLTRPRGTVRCIGVSELRRVRCARRSELQPERWELWKLPPHRIEIAQFSRMRLYAIHVCFNRLPTGFFSFHDVLQYGLVAGCRGNNDSAGRPVFFGSLAAIFPVSTHLQTDTARPANLTSASPKQARVVEHDLCRVANFSSRSPSLRWRLRRPGDELRGILCSRTSGYAPLYRSWTRFRGLLVVYMLARTVQAALLQ